MRKFQTGWVQGLALPLMVAAAVRLLLWAATLARTGTRVMSSGDTASYLAPGRNLLLHGSFQAAGLPEIVRTPGYPLFLAATSGCGLEVAALIQVALSVVCVFLVWRLAWTVFGSRRTAICAAWLLALEPVSIVYSARLLSETLFVVLFLVSLERLAAFLRDRQLITLAASGISLVAAIYVRPAAYALPLLWAMVIGVRFWGDRGLRWKAPAVLLVCTLPWLAAWQVRNYIETGYGGFSSIGIRNLYFFNAAGVLARTEGRDFLAVQTSLGYPNDLTYYAAHPEQKSWSEIQKLKFMDAQARRMLAGHWTEVLREQAAGSLVVLLTPCASDLMDLLGMDAGRDPVRVVTTGPMAAAVRIVREDPVRGLTMAILELWLLVLYGVAIYGVVRGAARRGGTLPVLALLVGTALYFVLISGGVVAVGRYRMPVMPVVCVLAAAGLRCAAERKLEAPREACGRLAIME